MRKIIAFLIVIAIIVGWCVFINNLPDYDLKSGVVISKDYTPPRPYTQFIHADGMMQTIQHVYPASWSIEVEGADGNGEIVTEWWGVDETTYHKVEVGDMVHRNK